MYIFQSLSKNLLRMEKKTKESTVSFGVTVVFVITSPFFQKKKKELVQDLDSLCYFLVQPYYPFYNTNAFCCQVLSDLDKMLSSVTEYVMESSFSTTFDQSIFSKCEYYKSFLSSIKYYCLHAKFKVYSEKSLPMIESLETNLFCFEEISGLIAEMYFAVFGFPDDPFYAHKHYSNADGTTGVPFRPIHFDITGPRNKMPGAVKKTSKMLEDFSFH